MHVPIISITYDSITLLPVSKALLYWPRRYRTYRLSNDARQDSD